VKKIKLWHVIILSGGLSMATIPCVADSPVTEEQAAPEKNLPPQQAAQAAAKPLPPWQPLGFLFEWLGGTPPAAWSLPRKLADIHLPGPDLANYPNSAFTVPQGSIYLETSPGIFTGKSDVSNAQWNWGYLLRYGVTDDIELRLLSDGLVSQGSTTGFAPLAFDGKIHLGAWEWHGFNAAVGVEGSVQSTSWLASPAYKGPVQYSFALLVDHELPWDIAFEWNIGFVRQHFDNHIIEYLPSLQWAFQRNISEDVAVFINGYHNSLPTAAASGIPALPWPQQQMAGLGAQWALHSRLAVFGNYNWGLTRLSPDYHANLGFALSF
jgi:hypothetical protein